MISENYKTRIQVLAGILNESELIEESTIEKLTDLGFSEKVGNELLNKNKKLSIFIGNLVAKEFAKSKGINNGEIKNILPMLDQEELYMFMKSKEGEINYILEWLKSANEAGDRVEIKEIDNLSDALKDANDWYENRPKLESVTDEAGEVKKVYPNRFYWLDLKTNESVQEKEAMGHCGKDVSATTLISLRDEKKNPHVTLSYNSNTQVIKQVKGKENKRPIAEYMVYVIDFLKELAEKGFVLYSSKVPVFLTGFKWSYSPHGDDLTKEDIQKIFTGKNYALYVYNMLIETLDNTVYNNMNMSIEEAKQIIGKDLYKKYIFKLLSKALENPAYNRLSVSQDEIKNTIGEENQKKFIDELVKKLLEGDSIHNLSNVTQKLRDNYGVNLTQQELKVFVGEGRYKEYIRTLLNKAMENPVVNKLEVTKQEIISELGIEAYIEYINKILQKIIENPINKKLNLTKDEIIEIVGKDNYNKFISSVISKITETDASYGLNTVIGILKTNYNLDVTPEQMKIILGDIKFSNFIKKVYNKAIENPLINKLDTDKDVVIDELGTDAYARFIKRILDVSIENPVNKKLTIGKDEIINFLGQGEYDSFVKRLLMAFLNDRSFTGELRLISKLEENFGIIIPIEQVKRIVGIQNWFMFIKRSKLHGSNFGHGHL